MHTISYDDGDRECLMMCTQQYEVIKEDETDNINGDDPVNTSDCNGKLNPKSVEITPICELTSETQDVIKQYREHFGFKEFTFFQAKGFPGFVLSNSYV